MFYLKEFTRIFLLSLGLILSEKIYQKLRKIKNKIIFIFCLLYFYFSRDTLPSSGLKLFESLKKFKDLFQLLCALSLKWILSDNYIVQEDSESFKCDKEIFQIVNRTILSQFYLCHSNKRADHTIFIYIKCVAKHLLIIYVEIFVESS